MAKLITKGAADCIEMENVGHLPALFAAYSVKETA